MWVLGRCFVGEIRSPKDFGLSRYTLNGGQYAIEVIYSSAVNVFCFSTYIHLWCIQ